MYCLNSEMIKCFVSPLFFMAVQSYFTECPIFSASGLNPKRIATPHKDCPQYLCRSNQGQPYEKQNKQLNFTPAPLGFVRIFYYLCHASLRWVCDRILDS